MHEAPDPYSPCPCGSGKKFKFCCRKLAPIAEKIIDMQQRNPEEALRLACEAEQQHPGNVFVLDMKFSTLLMMDRLDECLELVRKELQRNPGYVNGHCMIGDILSAKSEFREALTEYETVCELDRNYSGLVCVLGQMAFCCAKLGDRQRALDLAKEALHADQAPDYEEAWDHALDALEVLADDEATSDAIREEALGLIREYDPEDDEDDDAGEDDDELDDEVLTDENLPDLVQRGLEAGKTEDFDELLDVAERILEIAPESHVGLTYRFHALVQLGEIGEALEDFDTLIRRRLEGNDFIVDDQSSTMLGQYAYLQGLMHAMVAIMERLKAEPDLKSLSVEQQCDRYKSILERDGSAILGSYYTGTWITEPFPPFDGEIPLEASSSAKGKAFFRRVVQGLENQIKETAFRFDGQALRAKLHL